MALSDSLKKQLSDLVGSSDVVLFMKGRRRLPQCGFSAQVVQILDDCVDDYQTVNVLEDSDVREGIKAFSDWPTIPQLYIKGEFVGGCDIVTQLYESGELHTKLGVERSVLGPPSITITDSAAKALKEAMAGTEHQTLRLEIDSAFRPGLTFEAPGPNDLITEANGIAVLTNQSTAKRANGLTIDFVDGEAGGFRLDNPNAPPKS